MIGIVHYNGNDICKYGTDISINGINGGNMASVIPTLLMSVSMLLGTVLWPLLTKRHEKKQRIANENRRQEKYLEYLSEIGEKFKRLSRGAERYSQRESDISG